MAASPNFPKLPKNWTEESLTISPSQLHIRLYRSNDLSRGRFLYVIHGQGEQSGRYEHFPHYLNNVVDAIFCIDLPGHGKSQGIRGHIENFDHYSEAALTGFFASMDFMKKSASKIEAHWFGHSMGGLITLRTLLKETSLPLKTVTVSAPLLDLALPVPKLKKFFGELVEPILGRIKLSNELNGDLISHDKDVAKSYDTDSLNHGFVTPRFFVNLTKEMPLVRENRGPFAYNLLVLVPLGDQIVSWQAAYHFYENIQMEAGKKKNLTGFPNFFHESFNEIGKERAFNALSNWISSY